MADARPLIPAENPKPVDCYNCGEGQLHYSFIQPRFGQSPRYGFYCTSCSYTVAETVA